MTIQQSLDEMRATVNRRLDQIPKLGKMPGHKDYFRTTWNMRFCLLRDKAYALQKNYWKLEKLFSDSTRLIYKQKVTRFALAFADLADIAEEFILVSKSERPAFADRFNPLLNEIDAIVHELDLAYCNAKEALLDSFKEEIRGKVGAQSYGRVLWVLERKAAGAISSSMMLDQLRELLKGHPELIERTNLFVHDS